MLQKPNKIKVPNNVEHPRAANARLPLCLRLRASGRARPVWAGRQSACVVGARALASLAHLLRRAGHKPGGRAAYVAGVRYEGAIRESGLVGDQKIWARDFRRERAAVRGTGGADHVVSVVN